MNVNELVDRLSKIVGADHVSTDAAERDLSTSDIFEWPDRKPAVAVVRPATTAELAQVVTALAAVGAAAVPRGAGLSYTGGLAITTDCVAIDLTRINHIHVDEENLVATVGAGASWEAVAAALAPHKLRSLQPSPISGAYSTVGGLASQGLPAGTEGILGLTVVLSDGSVVKTGANPPVIRSVPDLTTLFLGDGGAFGIKSEVILRLGQRTPVTFATFEFDHASDLIEGLLACGREQLISRAFAMDRKKAEQARSVDAKDAVSATMAAIRGAGSLLGAAKTAAKLVNFAVTSSATAWSLHLTIEAPTQASADTQLNRVREICGAKGREAADVFPRTLYAKPYSVRGFVGPEGERWVPVHGIFQPAHATAAMQAMQDYLAAKDEEMTRGGITASWLVSSSGPYVLIEPMLFWRDQLDPIHMKYLSARNQERFGSFEANIPARRAVRAIRQGLRDVMDRQGAIHCQIGRFYDAGRQFDPRAFSIMQDIKKLLDPDNRMNPGVLGFGKPEA